MSDFNRDERMEQLIDRDKYNRQVIAKIWGIVKPNEESEYDTNNLYDRLRELVAAEKKLEGLK